MAADFEDPLEGYEGLSLFPETLGSFSNPPKPYDSHSNDLLYVHNFLKSLPIQNPAEFVEQAKIVLEKNLGLENIETMKDDPENHIRLEAENDVNISVKRRPGLGRKRAQFSLLQNTSQLPICANPTLDIDNLEDPEEFFLAFERLENAKMEIAKQTGFVSTDQLITCSAVRHPRRIGIQGRSKKVKYEHLYPTISCVETSEGMIRNPFNGVSHHEKASLITGSREKQHANHLASPPRELENTSSENTGSEVVTERNIDELLDELLACDEMELHGDGAVSLLLEKLQMKPLQVEKLNFPDLQDVQKINMSDSKGNLSKPRNLTPGTSNLIRGEKFTAAKRKFDKSTVAAGVDSSAPQRSPLASLSLLRKQLTLSNLSSDPFSAAPLNQSSDINACPLETNNEKIDHDQLMFPINEIDDPALNAGLPTVAADSGCADLSVKAAGDNMTGFDPEGDVCLEKTSILEHNCARMFDVQISGFIDLDEKVEDVDWKPGISRQPDLSFGDCPVEVLKNINELDKGYEANGCLELEGIRQDETQGNPSQQHVELPQEEINEIANPDANPKKRTRNERKRKTVNFRKSLADFGSSLETGVRRSTRIRSRPLEFWKGERFLYGRVHASLATVIGIKYESPAKGNEKPILKVKSFVADEYRHLVEQAALF